MNTLEQAKFVALVHRLNAERMAEQAATQNKKQEQRDA